MTDSPVGNKLNEGLNEADGSALHDVFDMGSITFSHDLLALKKPLKGKGL